MCDTSHEGYGLCETRLDCNIRGHLSRQAFEVLGEMLSRFYDTSWQKGTAFFFFSWRCRFSVFALAVGVASCDEKESETLIVRSRGTRFDNSCCTFAKTATSLPPYRSTCSAVASPPAKLFEYRRFHFNLVDAPVLAV